MIYDTLENMEKYIGINKNLDEMIRWLTAHDLNMLENGRIVVDGERLFVNVMDCEYRMESDAKFEAHRKYADIQISLTGDELIGWVPYSVFPDRPEDGETSLYTDMDVVSAALLPMKKGIFCILFPQDAHAPCIGNGKGHKICAKILL